jgi:hypothetical protein
MKYYKYRIVERSQSSKIFSFFQPDSSREIICSIIRLYLDTGRFTGSTTLILLRRGVTKLYVSSSPKYLGCKRSYGITGGVREGTSLIYFFCRSGSFLKYGCLLKEIFFREMLTCVAESTLLFLYIATLLSVRGLNDAIVLLRLLIRWVPVVFVPIVCNNIDMNS